MTKIISLMDRKKAKDESKGPSEDDPLIALACPHCKASYFTPILEEVAPKQYEVAFLLCVSEVCMGEVYVAVNDGILDDHFTRDEPPPAQPDDLPPNDNIPK